jgi:nitronate monooxygenase
VLTTVMSGRLARGAPNRAIRTIEAAGNIAPFPAQNWLTGRFRTTAGTRELGDLQSLWLGQASLLAHHEDAELLLAELTRGLTA